MDIEKILSKMTLKEKIALCEGASFWKTRAYKKYGIPMLFMCDGPHGLRKQEAKGGNDNLGIKKSRPATCFPASVTTACSWDPNLTKAVGSAIGREALAQKVGLVLGPGCNLKRNPLCGRNFEYYSEDPYLSGKMAAGFIRGVQEQGVGTSLKHFAANSQELDRLNSDSRMDERTLHEIYLTGFEIAVKEGKPAAVMCAYNKLSGTYCSDNKELLADILRKQWGFDGMVVTDWGAMNDRVAAFVAGCDLNMPGASGYMFRETARAVKEGRLQEADIDNSVHRILKLAFRAREALKQDYICDYDAHHGLARQAARQSAVLLKNEDGLLPLQENARVAVIGAMAQNMRYQGVGSSHVNPIKLSQPAQSLAGCLYAPGCDDKGDTTEEMLSQAAAAARECEVAVVFAGLPEQYESEGFDRENMKMPEGHIRMIHAVAEANPNTVVVLLCGSPVECPWEKQVKSILYMGLCGQAGGEAVADLLYGKVNPSGKLAESWPYAYADVPSADVFCKSRDAHYIEGIYVGYRYYDKAGVPVRWPFGYGLSYTRFAYSDLQMQDRTVTVTLTNTGSLPGAEVAQLYVIAPQEGIHRPVRELKGFQKVFLQPGESKTLTFALNERSFALWHKGWKVPGGVYTIAVGGLSQSIHMEGEQIEVPSWQPGSWYETCKGKPSQTDWEKIAGKAAAPQPLKKGSFTMNNTVAEMKDSSFVMKVLFKAVELVMARDYGGKVDYSNPEFRMMMNCSVGSPLRCMQISGGIPGSIMLGLLEMANGHFFKGLWKMIKG